MGWLFGKETSRTKFLKLTPRLVKKGDFYSIINLIEKVIQDIDDGEMKEWYIHLKKYYTNLINTFIEKKNSQQQNIESYLDQIMGDVCEEQCKKSLLFNYLNDYLTKINTKKEKLNFQKLINELTVCQLFNLNCEDDEILSSLPNEYEKCREVNKRLKQIVEAVDNYNLTAKDIIEIIGNVQIKYLIKVFPKVLKEYKIKTFLQNI